MGVCLICLWPPQSIGLISLVDAWQSTTEERKKRDMLNEIARLKTLFNKND
jgi:hypothetical protein